MSRRRQTIARRLLEAQHGTASLTTFNEVDLHAVMELRKRRQDDFVKKHGIKLGFMSFFTRAVIGALKAFPRVNAEIQGDEIVLKHYYDIGTAVVSWAGSGPGAPAPACSRTTSVRTRSRFTRWRAPWRVGAPSGGSVWESNPPEPPEAPPSRF